LLSLFRSVKKNLIVYGTICLLKLSKILQFHKLRGKNNFFPLVKSWIYSVEKNHGAAPCHAQRVQQLVPCAAPSSALDKVEILGRGEKICGSAVEDRVAMEGMEFKSHTYLGLALHNF